MAKEWSWSFSKKKNYDTCPKRHYEVDIARNFNDSSEALVWGNEVHAALQKACSGKAPLPETMCDYQKWVETVRATGGKTLVEQKYAITRDFQATTYFAHNVWYRGICDLLQINQAGDKATAIDWKTGKVKHDSVQLMLMATCIFVHFPAIQQVTTRFIWLQEDCTTRDIWDRPAVMKAWGTLIPEVNAMEQAYKTNTFPPKPGALCRSWCPVTSCPFHGKGAH